MIDPRSLLLALNAAPLIHRAAVCRLAKAPEIWLEAPPVGDAARDEEGFALGLPPRQLARARAVARDAAAIAGAEIARANIDGATILTRLDAGYPPELEDLELPPPVLYLLGSLAGQPSIAIVGSREATDYGRAVAGRFARSFAEAGVTVVSGFARGIDTTAHRAALEPPGGRTVAVLGCGLDVAYPSRNDRLRREIPERGAILTEFPFGCEPRPWRFPIRNRVIAALSAATLVVEAATRSGSLITAHHALELGRDVWAVPGRISDETAQGPNSLLSDGARLAQHPRDVLETLKPPCRLPLELEVPIAPPPRALPTGLGGKILALLPSGVERSADDLTVLSGLPVEQLLTELLDLELGGWLRRLPGSLYRRTLA